MQKKRKEKKKKKKKTCLSASELEQLVRRLSIPFVLVWLTNVV
jgi:hypothetical protein